MARRLSRTPIFLVGLTFLGVLGSLFLTPTPVDFSVDNVEIQEISSGGVFPNANHNETSSGAKIFLVTRKSNDKNPKPTNDAPQENVVNQSHNEIPHLHSERNSATKVESTNKTIDTVVTDRNENYVSELTKLFEGHKSKNCLTDSCFEETAKKISRAFPDRTNKNQWCVPKDDTRTVDENDVKLTRRRGLILVKVPKAASSTMAGVVLRLGRRYHCDEKNVHWSHIPAYKGYHRRDPRFSFMLLSVRNPASQLISNVFWTDVTLQERSEEAQKNEAWLLSRTISFGSTQGSYRSGQGGFALQYASLDKIRYNSAWSRITHDVVDPEAIVQNVKAIVDAYDFIAVVERMDESLVALSLLLGVHVGDVLVSSSKVSGQKGDAVAQKEILPYVYSMKLKKCLPMIPSIAPPLVQRYLDSDVFRSLTYGDHVLHVAANLSLDLTIQRLGEERFQAALKEYRYWKEREPVECASRVEFPCSRNGEVQLELAEENCYKNDLGCGHQCIDEMLARGR